MSFMKKLFSWFFKRFSKWRKAIPIKFKEFNLDISKDKKDERDYVQTKLPKALLPSFLDYSQHVPPIKYQGRIGSCGSHAMVTGLETLENMKSQKWSIPLSELFHYYYVRQKEYENTFPKDSGQHGRNSVKLAKNIGVAPEKLYPYNTTNYNTLPKLPKLVKSMARFWKINKYERCYSLTAIKSALSEKKLVWFGVPVNRSIFAYKKGILQYSKKETQAGGHAMLVVGYSDEKKALKVVNSWGLSWGGRGYGWIAYDYLYNVTWFDAWSFDIENRGK